MFWTSAVPAFLASLVEFVEALTIVLAVGISINWKSALTGALAAAAVLAVLTAVFGVAVVTYVPLSVLRAVIGVLLVLFGAQWLKKALLRYSGLKSLRDESALFERQVRTTSSEDKRAFSSYGFLASFKSVLLEGLEVAFIVITFGATSGAHFDGLWAAIEGALGALAVVILLGLLLVKPLTKVPENLLKFAVGWILLTFGIFWTGEGLGIEWPLADLFLLVLGAVNLAVCAGLSWFLRGQNIRGYQAAPEAEPPRAWWSRTLFELFDFFCGDWWMAGGTAVVLTVAYFFPLAGATFLVGILAVFALAVSRSATRPRVSNT